MLADIEHWESEFYAWWVEINRKIKGIGLI